MADPRRPIRKITQDSLTAYLAEVRRKPVPTPQEELAGWARFLGASPPADMVEMLTERTEGWIAGLRLAALFKKVMKKRSMSLSNATCVLWCKLPINIKVMDYPWQI